MSETKNSKALTKEQRHLLLVESAWGSLEAQFKEILNEATLEGKVLPSRMSIPFHGPSGEWVRLTLEISRLREGDA